MGTGFPTTTILTYFETGDKPTQAQFAELINGVGTIDDNSPLNNFTATTAPTVNDDNTQGYSVGSAWINTSTGDSYLASSVSAGAAVWSTSSGGGGGVTDGDKGDITVTGSGTVWTIDSLAITTGKIANGAVTSAKIDAGVIPTTLPPSNNGYRTNYFYLSGNADMTTSGGTLPANTINYSPIYVGYSDTFTRIGVRTVTGGATNARLGIYNCSNGIATTLVLDAGAVSLASTGNIEITISQALTPGIYMMACNFDNATAVLAYQDSTTAGIASYINGSDVSTDIPMGTNQSIAYGPLPALAGTQSAVSGSAVPIMWLRKV